MNYIVTHDIKDVDEILRNGTLIDEGPRVVIEVMIEQTDYTKPKNRMNWTPSLLSSITEESSAWVWFLSEENGFVAHTFR